MSRASPALFSFNKGIVSEFGLARVDIERIQLSASHQRNWIPQSLGPMSLRPGLQLILQTLAGAKPKYLPFVFAVDDVALIEFTPLHLRPLVNEAPIPIAASAVADPPYFAAGLPGWTNVDEAGATSAYNGASGFLKQTGTRYAHARVRCQLVIPAGEVGVVHALRIVVNQDEVQFRIGTAAGLQDVRAEATLAVGDHILAFTPAGSVWIEVSHSGYQPAITQSIVLYENADVAFTTFYAKDDLSLLRFDQSADVMYLACKGTQQYKLTRRDHIGSWSFVPYRPKDGPFRGLNVTTTKITPSAVRGTITLTASQDVFESTHVGALFRVESVGQFVSEHLTGADQWTLPIRVFGVGSGRHAELTLTGAWVGQLTLQRSFGEPGTWEDVSTHPGVGVAPIDDGLDNQLVYYRIGFKTGDWTSGYADASLSYKTGSNTGIARITTYTNPKLVSAIVLQEMGNITVSENWYEGAWSTYRGWPSSVLLYEGRLSWQGKDNNWMSISDEFESFDDTFPGDAGPIQRSIGSGPVDTVNWALGLQRMVLGGGGAEHSVRSSSLDEPLTPTNYNIKPCSTLGSAPIPAVRVDSNGLFVQRSRQRLYEMTPDTSGVDYQSTDVTVLVPEICYPEIVALDVQRQPDTRVHAVRSDGMVALLVYNKAENVKAWVEVGMGDPADRIVDVCVLPGDGREDLVYYVVRTGGLHYLCRWVREIECRGGSVNKLADMFVEQLYSHEAPGNIVTGLGHIEGRTVVVWADGADRGTAVVVGGQVVLDAAYGRILVGLPYKAQYRSSKLGRIGQQENSVKRRKNITGLGVILAYTHADGLYYGPDFDTLDPLPEVEDEEVVDPNKVWDAYDKDSFEFNGDWDVDSRVCLEARAPKPCTVLAITMLVESHDKG